MKEFARVIALCIGFSFYFASCQKAPEIILYGPASIELNADNSSGTISFTANRDWTASCSDSWISVSPSRGAASDEPVALTIRCDANTTFDDRQASVTIQIESLSQTVIVKQPANLGIVLSTQSYELASEAKTIEIVVQANVQYTVSSSASWIKQTNTKGLNSDKLTFSIEKNNTYDPREGKITIKSQNSAVADQIIIRQAQKDALIIQDTSFEMPYGGGGVEIKVETNVEFDVKPDVDWIHFVETKALSNSTIYLTVDENETYSDREGKIDIAQKNGSLTHTVKVKQAGRIAVSSVELNRTSLSLFAFETAELTASVKPENATDKTITWSSSDENVATVVDGLVTAVSTGDAVITAMAGSQKADCNVSVKPFSLSAVDLGLSVKWGNANLGAKSIEESGDHYAWGETETKEEYTWTTYKWCNGIWTKLTKYNNDHGYGTPDYKVELEDNDDDARVRLGGKWRMPTKAEYINLIDTWKDDNYLWEKIVVNGQEGWRVTYLVNNNAVFFPIASYQNDEKLVEGHSLGWFWSSSLDKSLPPYGEGLSIGLGGIGMGSAPRNYGISIRPVSE